MIRYFEIFGAWIGICLLLSVAVAFLLAGPGGVEVGAIIIVLLFSVGLLCACIHSVVVAVRSKNKKHTLIVCILAGMLFGYITYQLIESRKCKFTESNAREYLLQHLSKYEGNVEFLGEGKLQETDCVFRFEYNDPEEKKYFYVSDWGNVGVSSN